VIVGRRPGPPEILIAGVVRAFVPDTEPLLRALADFRPEALGIGLGPEELEAYSEHFVDTRAEPLAPLLPTEQAEVLGIARFGDVELPHLPFLAAISWARHASVPVLPTDLTEEEYADLFSKHIGYLELLHRTLAERRLARKGPPASTADEFVLRWADSVGAGRRSREFEAERTAAILATVRELGSRHRRFAVVVDRERYPAVLAGLG
jgi:hypothetical protein